MAERTKIGMSLDEFISRFEEQPFELINGEMWNMTPAKKKHSKISKRLYDRLLFHLVDNDLGEVFFESAFIIEDVSDWVSGSRIPDVMFYEKSRFDAHDKDNPDDDGKPFILVPDLVVEVISPSDKYSDVTTKVDAYLKDGVKLIWIVDPQRKTIAVYEGSDSPRTLRVDDTLTGANILPDFETAVKEIFLN
ncbi:MAG: Uma2 family endonuclease [Chloroflexota bacterium]